MTFRVKGARHRHRVRFSSENMTPSTSQTNSPASSSSTPLDAAAAAQERTGYIIEELSGDDSGGENWLDEEEVPMATWAAAVFSIPDMYKTYPPLRDILVTDTSLAQDEAVRDCLPYLRGESGEFSLYNKYGLPHLDRARHIRFLHRSLQDLPSGFVAADAARPWFFYWALCGLRTLGEDVSSYRERLISTVRPMQNFGGGFGGGHGQMSHLAPTYAIVLALAVVGGEDALEIIDRKAMWRWLGAVKQPDGGFQMFIGGEEDVRGAYCAAVIISLLDLPLELPSDSPAKSHETDTLFTRTPEYVGRCQTFEGGISSHPDGEAHGGYAFCGLACLSIIGEPHIIIPKYLDVPALIAWLSARQYAPEGGYSGRTNKLVDGCYSHWVGGCWPLINAALNTSMTSTNHTGNLRNTTALFDREGLIRYILCVCQDTSRRGGLRDKPSKNSDGYHTCYVLAGLSSAQHSWSYTPTPTSISSMTSALSHPYQWTVERFRPTAGEEEVFDEVDRVGTLHPVFVIPTGVAEKTRDFFVAKGGFS